MTEHCEACGSTEGTQERKLVRPDSGSAMMCWQCWLAYCEQTGANILGDWPDEQDWHAYVQRCPQVQPGVALPIPANAWMIYALIDPRTQAVRYVGMTQQLVKRRRQHLANESGGPQKRAWVEELASANLQPVMRVLQVLEYGREEAHVYETCWRTTLSSAGMELLNATRDGLFGPIF